MDVRIVYNPPTPQFVKGQMVHVKPEMYEYTQPEYLQLLIVEHAFSVEPADTPIGSRIVNQLVTAGYLSRAIVTEIEVGPYDSNWSQSIRVDDTPLTTTEQPQ